MTKFSWRTLVLSLVATFAILAGCSNSLQACCFSWLCGGFYGGGCCDNSYGAGYYGGGYSAGYYGGYYGGYAPAYGGCNSCSTGAGYYPYGGIAYGGGAGCSSCADVGCGTSLPGTYVPNRDAPVDEFEQGAPPSDLNRTPIDSRKARPRTIPKSNSTLPSTKIPSTKKTDPLNEGFPGDPDRAAPEESPMTEHEMPMRRRSGVINTEKPPMPADTETPAEPADPDSFPTDDTTTTPMKTNRPVLGTPTETDETAPEKSVFPKKAPAPIDLPDEPESEPSDPADANELKLDDTNSTSAVSPRTRLALQSRFSTPSVARIRLRPNHKWIAEPEAPKLAQQ